MNNLLQNFFGMSTLAQLAFLTEIKNSEDELSKDVYKEFYMNFNYYLSEISELYEKKDVFFKYNSNQKRYARYKLFDYLSTIISEHSGDNSMENAKAYYTYHHGDDMLFYQDRKQFENILNRYFAPKKISDEDALRYTENYSKMSSEEKDQFVEKFNDAYSEFNIALPSPNAYLSNIVPEYKNTIIYILGYDLYECYDKLHTIEKYSFIQKICLVIYNIKISGAETINDPEAVRARKKEALLVYSKIFNPKTK